MKLAMGCDPAAYRFYKKLLERMKEEGYDIVDTGCESENEADGGKYAEIAEIVSNKVVSKECDYWNSDLWNRSGNGNGSKQDSGNKSSTLL